MPPPFETIATLTVPNGGTARRRRALEDCPATLGPMTRVDLVQGAAAFYSTSTSNVNLLAIRPVLLAPNTPEEACAFEVSLTLNNVTTCEEARDTQGDAVNSESRLQAALNAQGDSTFIVEDVATRVDECMVVALPPVAAVSDDDLASTILPAALVAGALLVLGGLAFVVLRRQPKRTERGVDGTFDPRTPVVLPSDRHMPGNEFSLRDPALLASEPWQYAKGTPDGDNERVASPTFDEYLTGRANPPAYDRAAQTRALLGRGPEYRPPPAYPYEAGLDGSLGAPYATVPGGGRDGVTTVTTTTTTVTRYGDFKEPPPYARPPDYASALSLLPEDAGRPFVFDNEEGRPLYELPLAGDRMEEVDYDVDTDGAFDGVLQG